MHDLQDKNSARPILVAMLLGLLIGILCYFLANGTFGEKGQEVGSACLLGVKFLKPIGTIFIKLLRMIIVPLVFSSIFMAMVNLGTPKTLGSMGRKAISYYFITTAMAVLIGLILVNIIRPGVGVSIAEAGLHGLSESMAQKVQQNQGLMQTIADVLMDAIPSNPVHSMAEGNILQIILFAVLMGIVALFHRERSEPVIKTMQSLEEMSLVLTHWIMRLAPLGVFVLMLDVMAKTGFDAIISLSKYMLTVIIGLFVHGGVLLAVASFFHKRSPWFILRGMGPALTTAFSTASSAATLPITMANVEDNLGVKKETAKFVLPLGATINMDGTALYESVAAIFIAQAYQIHLTLGQQLIIFLTASLAAVGAAAIPGAGLITMSIVLSAVGLPLEGVGLILAVDRILDMFRTTINVFGDSVGTIVVDALMPDSPDFVDSKLG